MINFDLESVNRAILKQKRRARTERNKTLAVAAEPIALESTPIKEQKQKISIYANFSPPLRSECPLAPAEQCFYGFFTNLCIHCQSLRYILDNMPFMLPESAAVEIIRDSAREDALDNFLDLIKGELEIDNDSIVSFGEELIEKIELQLPENGLEGLSLNQLEIIKTIILLKDEPSDSIIVKSLREIVEKLPNRIENSL